jgi:hypothetical protein
VDHDSLNSVVHFRDIAEQEDTIEVSAILKRSEHIIAIAYLVNTNESWPHVVVNRNEAFDS